VGAAAGTRALSVAIIAAFSVAALAGFTILVVHDPVSDLSEHLPGADDRPADLPPSAAVKIGEGFARSGGVPSSITASWPGFRGAWRDNTSRETVALATPGQDWKPAILWDIPDLGEGHAGAAVSNGRVYVLDYDEKMLADSLRCFSLDDGREIWRRWYRVPLKRNHGISRTVPAVSGRYVVTLGPNCQLMCCDAMSGDFLWGCDLPGREFGAEVPNWYAGQCPLIDGGQVVIGVCGPDALLTGVDLATGRVAWRTPNPRGLKMSHSSIVVTEIEGVRMYVYAAIGGIVGVSAEPGGGRGALLWDSADFNATVIAPTPVPLSDGKIFLTAGYGAGSIMLRVSANGGAFAAEVLDRWSPSAGFSCEQQTPVVLDGMLIGILPTAAGTRREELACWDPAGRWAWLSGQDRRFGQYGPFLLADGKLVILNEDGVLTIAEATTTEYRPLGSAKILEGPDAWAPMALVAGRLLARDTHRMVCVDLRRDR
jgi:outer membrane protein assembly factor BamB